MHDSTNKHIHRKLVSLEGSDANLLSIPKQYPFYYPLHFYCIIYLMSSYFHDFRLADRRENDKVYDGLVRTMLLTC